MPALGRVNTGYASAYNAAQVQVSKVRRYQRHTLTADFRGAIPPDGVIGSVTWSCTSPWITFMSAPAVSADQKSVTVDVRYNYAGMGCIKATVTLDEGGSVPDGPVYDYEFQITVTDAPMYPDATYSSASGPFSVSAVAP